jgi:hypothetical protein
MSALNDIRFGRYPGLSHSLSIPTSNDAKGNLSWTLMWQALKDHMRQAGAVLVHAQIITEFNFRVGEKVSGLHRVMTTEQKQNLPCSHQNKLRLESPTSRQTATRIDERIRVRDLFECECYLRYPLSTISGVIKFIVDSDIE